MDEYDYDDQQLPVDENYDNHNSSPHFNNRKSRRNDISKKNNSQSNERKHHNNRPSKKQANNNNDNNNNDNNKKDNKNNNQNNSNENNNSAADSSNNRLFNKNNKDDDTDKKLKVIIKKVLKKAFLLPIITILFPLLIVFMVFIVLFSDESNYDGSQNVGNATSGYYPINCQDVTVIFTDKSNNYEVTGNGTYSIEDYVAGVINGEVGGFNNLEVYKEYAIAARTYFLRNADNCSIESSDRKQVFRDSPSSLMKQAAEETKGQVLLNSNGELMSTEYDAFCSIDIDDEYYTIKQKNQRIPITWVERQSGIISEWKTGTCAGNHGRGSSQWGSYYLATEKDYDYKELLDYYYSDHDNKISISSNSFTSSIAGLDIKETRNATYELNQPITSFLSSKGSSLEDYNNFIRKSVEEAGVGTRAGVVAGAVSMINYLYDNFNTKLPYYWGGASQDLGIPSSFGKQINSSPSVSGKIYHYVSFDCSGFTSWAVKNGGYNIRRLVVSGFDALVGPSNMCNITNSSCIGQPGDFISYKKQHIKMIVSVDKPNNKYYVAESTTSGVIITTQDMHTKGSVETNILHMDSFYNNPNNVNQNY